jgi:hypothetical protein
VDVEGGRGNIVRHARGAVLLIDTGWPGNDGRDADRIVTAARKAGLNKIDYVLITIFTRTMSAEFPLAARSHRDIHRPGENREMTLEP